METKKLTAFSKGSGCGCKINPERLKNLLSGLNTGVFEGLVVGREFSDDAAVFRLNDRELLISTTDFFTPFVNNAFDFGRIAAANAISDVYAMGGKPVMALALLGWPLDQLSAESAAEVLKGAEEICAEAGIPLAGGHSIEIDVPVFGLSVNGIVKTENLKRNNTAKEGDLIFITKPIGTGILSSAVKREIILEKDYIELIKISTALNKIGNKVGELKSVHAMTDVTGFGLLGHLIEVCAGSNLTAEIILEDIPVIDGLEYYTSKFCFPDNTYRNWNSYAAETAGADGPQFIILCDPQTNGGLLVFSSQEGENELKKFAKEENCLMKRIGVMKRKEEKMIVVK